MSTTKYLPPDVVARAQALGLKARTIVEGLRVGDHKSPFRGFSVEFVQHREYVPGDDIRHIDWKSYGRSERYTIKQYEQETDFIAHILLDASRSMLYGERATNKLEYAKLLAAVLAYTIIHQRDSASLSIFDNAWRTQLPISSQPGHLMMILEALESTQPADKTTIAPLLHDLAQQIRRRGLVFLISDCFTKVEELLSGLQHLRFQGHDVAVLHIMHPDELQFPFDGLVKFDDVELPRHLLTRPELIKRAYLRTVQQFIEDLQRGCENNRCDYLLVDTGRQVGATLSMYLARRLRIKEPRTK
jgi:uncharacterized protein (DUF58 family)